MELRPLMLWMANTTELLSFVQEKVLEMEKEADQEGELGPDAGLSKPPAASRTGAPGLPSASLRLSLSLPDLPSDPQLCNDLELCDEAMALLDEVIMCTFQQSVYYLTKVGPHPRDPSGMSSLPAGAPSRGSGATSYWTSQHFLLR